MGKHSNAAAAKSADAGRRVDQDASASLRLLIISDCPERMKRLKAALNVGEIEITGAANTTSFSFYKVEIARKNEPLWLTIQAGRERVEDGTLVPLFDTTRLPVDDYVLQLVVVDLAGEALPPCRIPLRIEAP